MNDSKINKTKNTYTINSGLRGYVRTAVLTLSATVAMSLLLCGTALADTGRSTEYTAGAFKYVIVDGEIVITEYFGKESEVTVPAQIGYKPVTVIESGAFDDAPEVEKVIVPEGTEIQSGALPSNVKPESYAVTDDEIGRGVSAQDSKFETETEQKNEDANADGDQGETETDTKNKTESETENENAGKTEEHTGDTDNKDKTGDDTENTDNKDKTGDGTENTDNKDKTGDDTGNKDNTEDNGSGDDVLRESDIDSGSNSSSGKTSKAGSYSDTDSAFISETSSDGDVIYEEINLDGMETGETREVGNTTLTKLEDGTFRDETGNIYSINKSTGNLVDSTGTTVAVLAGDTADETIESTTDTEISDTVPASPATSPLSAILITLASLTAAGAGVAIYKKTKNPQYKQ